MEGGQSDTVVVYLEDGVEDFEDLFLDEDRVGGVVGEQLDEAVPQHGQEDVHGRHQRLTLLWLLVSVQRREVSEITVGPDVLRSGTGSSAAQTLRPPQPPPTRSF